MNACPPKPGSTVMIRTMSSSSAYGSSADSGVAGLTARPAARPAARIALQGRRDRLVDLDVERDRVAAGVEVLVDVAAGLADHQVGVERDLGPRPQRLDRLRAERQVRDEVGVHDVEVDAIRAGTGHAPNGVGEVAEVGVEDARGDARAPGATPGSRLVRLRHLLAADQCRGRLVAALPAQRGGARELEALAPARDRGRGRLPGPLGGELAARGPDLLAAVAPDRRADPGLDQHGRERLDDRHRARLPRRVRDLVHRDEVDVRVVAAQEVGEGLRIEVRVVHAADHRVLVADPPAGRARVVAGRVDDLGHRPAPVERDEHVAQGVARGVERDRPA